MVFIKSKLPLFLSILILFLLVGCGSPPKEKVVELLNISKSVDLSYPAIVLNNQDTCLVVDDDALNLEYEEQKTLVKNFLIPQNHVKEIDLSQQELLDSNINIYFGDEQFYKFNIPYKKNNDSTSIRKLGELHIAEKESKKKGFFYLKIGERHDITINTSNSFEENGEEHYYIEFEYKLTSKLPGLSKNEQTFFGEGEIKFDKRKREWVSVKYPDFSDASYIAKWLK